MAFQFGDGYSNLLWPTAAVTIMAAILVEYDALPGVGHACGHCAISVLAGLVLNEPRDSIDGQFDLIGTHDEAAYQVSYP